MRYWEKFTNEIENVSQRYTNRLAEILADANDKLKESAKTLDLDGTIYNKTKEEAIAVAIAIAVAYNQILAASPAFINLSLTLKVKFATAGLRGTWRIIPVADNFYLSSVPQVVRNFGEKAVVEFLENKQASHLKAVANNPSLTADDGNIIWEAVKNNIVRGSNDMTSIEFAKANAANVIDAVGIVTTQTLQIAVKAGCIGMALEGVVSIGENMIYVYAGKRTGKEAVLDVSKNMAKKGFLSAVSGVIVSIAIAFGAGPALTAMAPVMVTVGGTVYLLVAVKRIAGAYQEINSETVIAT